MWAAISVNVFGVWEFWVFKVVFSWFSCFLPFELYISKWKIEVDFDLIKMALFFFCLGVCVVRARSQVSCPYSEMNLNKEGLLPDRLSGERPLALCGPQPRGRRPDQNTNPTTQSSSTPEQQEGAEESQNRCVTEHEQSWQSAEKQHGCSFKATYTPGRAPFSALHLASTLLPVPESRISVLLGNRGQRKLSAQEATASLSHWVEPVSRATMERGPNGAVMKHQTRRCSLCYCRRACVRGTANFCVFFCCCF